MQNLATQMPLTADISPSERYRSSLWMMMQPEALYGLLIDSQGLMIMYPLLSLTVSEAPSSNMERHNCRTKPFERSPLTGQMEPN